MIKWTGKMNFNIEFYLLDEPGIDNSLGCIRYENKKLAIENKIVPSIVDGNKLYWKDKDRIGSLSFINNSRIMRGIIIEGSRTYRVKASANLTIPLEFSGENLPKTKFNLVMGSRIENGNVIPYLVLREENIEQNYGYGTTYEKKDGDTYHTHVRLSILPLTDEYLGFGFMDVAFDDSYSNVSGFAWINEEEASKTDPVCTVSGNTNASHAIDQGSEVQLSDICTSVEKKILDKCDDLPCVEELFTMPMPIVDDVNNSYPNAVYDLMRYAISDEQRKYINVKRPDYTDDETKDADEFLKDEDIKDFLTKDFYYAILSQMLAENSKNPYSSLITDIPDYDKKLDGYFSSSNSTSMNQSKGYQKLTQLLYPKLYFRNSPILKSYLDDKMTWAKTLHLYALCNENAYSMVDDYSHNPQSRMHNVVVLLDYFDYGKNVKLKNKMQFSFTDEELQDYYITYGSDIYYNLYNKQLALNCFSFRFSDSVMNQDERKKFYEESAKKIINDIYSKSNLSEYEKQIKDSVDEAVSNKAISSWTDAYSVVSFFVCEFEAGIAGIEGCPIACITKFFEMRPGTSLFVRGLSLVLCQSLMIINQVINFKDWKNLNDAQRAQTILSMTYTAVDIFAVGEKIYKFSQAPKVMAAAASEVADEMQEAVKATEGLGSREVEQISEKAKDSVEELKVTVKEVSTFGKIADGILSALAFAISVCDIINDEEEYGWKSGVFWCDILTSVVNGLAMVATVGMGLFGEVVVGIGIFSASLSTIGLVCTTLGILFCLIVYMVKKWGSKTLEQKYIEANCVPFVKSLEIPEDDKEVIDLVYDELSGTYRMPLRDGL